MNRTRIKGHKHATKSADSIVQSVRECFVTGDKNGLPENWAPVAGYEGWYEVSTFGNVRSVDRTIVQESRWGRTTPRLMRGKRMNPIDNGHGYLVVSFRKGDGKRKNHYIHRLVAQAFCLRPNGTNVVNHKDYDTKNNCCSNLEWVTQRENIIHSICNMQKPKGTPTASATGEKYIYFKQSRYRLSVPGKIDRTFPSLCEAVSMREVVLGGR